MSDAIRLKCKHKQTQRKQLCVCCLLVGLHPCISTNKHLKQASKNKQWLGLTPLLSFAWFISLPLAFKKERTHANTLCTKLNTETETMASTKSAKHILWFKEIGIEDVPVVGGKNASLGEMYVCMRVILLLSSTPRSLAHTITPLPFFLCIISVVELDCHNRFQALTPKGINIPNGFAITASAYFYFLDKAGIRDEIRSIMQGLDITDTRNLEQRGAKVCVLRGGGESACV